MALFRRLALVFLLVALGAFPGRPSAAQDAAPAQINRSQVDSLITTLQDDAARAKLIEQLHLLTQAQDNTQPQLITDGLGARLLSLISERVEYVSKSLAQAGDAIYSVPMALRWISREAADPIERGHWIETAIKVVLVLGLATAIELVVIRWLGRFRRRLDEHPRNGWITKILAVLARAFLELLPIFAFAAAAYGILPLTEPREATRLIVLTLVNASVLARAILALGRIVLSPGLVRLRMVPIGDETANYAQIWLRRFVNVAVYGYFLAQGLVLIGVPIAIYEILLRIIGLLLAAMAIVIVLQNRTAGAAWLGGSTRGASVRVRLADVWHLVAILIIVVLFLVWAFAIPGGIEFLLRGILATMVLVTAARLITLSITKAVKRGFALNTELKQRYPGLEARANRYLPIMQRVLTSAVWLVAVLALLEAWGVNSFGWLGSDVGRRVTGSVISIALVSTIVWLAWEALDSAMERYLEERGPDGQLVERSARMRTLLPLIRNAVRIVLASMALLIVLSELGLNIGPLLAGAGVVGLAIGFGAQTLVKDVITGFFILIEESMSVGDVVDLGGHGGVVESMTIRSVRVRDVSGSVHIIPFSSVTTVVNMTKEFAYAVFNVSIAYEEDLDRATAVLQEIGRSLQQDPVLGPSILAAIEVFGIDSFTDIAVKLQARMKTRPGRQWAVTREFNRRVKMAFEEAGIEIPHQPYLPRSSTQPTQLISKAMR
jgi:small conductance mechanosensitive channel